MNEFIHLQQETALLPEAGWQRCPGEPMGEAETSGSLFVVFGFLLLHSVILFKFFRIFLTQVSVLSI